MAPGFLLQKGEAELRTLAAAPDQRDQSAYSERSAMAKRRVNDASGTMFIPESTDRLAPSPGWNVSVAVAGISGVGRD